MVAASSRPEKADAKVAISTILRKMALISAAVIGLVGISVELDCFEAERDMEKGFLMTRVGEMGGKSDELVDEVLAKDALEAEASYMGVVDVDGKGAVKVVPNRADEEPDS